MFWFQNALFTFALVLTATNLSYGRRWYGPDGIQPARPLGPGGVQPIQPLGPGGIRKSSKSLALLTLSYAIFDN